MTFARAVFNKKPQGHMDTIYAILDKLSNDIIGPLWVLKHDAVAVRQFADIASRPDNMVSQHLGDHELIAIGTLGEDNNITPEYRVVITGTAWKAAQTEQLELTK